MLYKIDNKYYVKVENYFVEVDLIYKDNDVDLKPTNNKIEHNRNIVYTEFDFMSNKEKLIKEHNSIKSNKISEDKKDNEKLYRYSK